MSRSTPSVSRAARFAAAALCLAACKGERHVSAAPDASTDVASDGATDAADAPPDLGPPCRVGGTSADQPTTLGCSAAPPGQIVVAGGYLYWTIQGAGAIVWRAPLVGGVPEALVWDTSGAFGLVVDDTFVYYGQVSANRVMRFPLSGGAPTVLTSKANQPLFLASDGKSLYWTEGAADGKVVKLDLVDGAQPVTLIDGQAGPRALALRDGYVYWTDVNDGTILRTPDHLTGPADAAVRTASRLASGLKTPTDLLVLGGYAYVPDGNGFIQRVPLEGGELERVTAVAGIPYGVATDGASICWSARGIPGGLFETPLDAIGADAGADGGDASVGTLVVGDQADPHFVALTSDNVYWTTWGPRPAVHRIAR